MIIEDSLTFDGRDQLRLESEEMGMLPGGRKDLLVAYSESSRIMSLVSISCTLKTLLTGLKPVNRAKRRIYSRDLLT
jgi:hypothetical protein